MCGFCSTEQPLGDRCTSCDKRLTSSARRGPSGRTTRFWEVRLSMRRPHAVPLQMYCEAVLKPWRATHKALPA